MSWLKMLLPSAFGYNSDAAENEIDQTSIESERAKNYYLPQTGIIL
ncbi:MAG: hypothetical protein HC786_27560 [Richelia sp. CSU_2_1]|nr:hypothetical protein [Richelia sp. CSU_2_1]